MSQASTVKGNEALAKRLAVIDRLCAMRGTQYQGLRQYREL
jgi:hypothetical protein